jgi:hypothetical protein
MVLADIEVEKRNVDRGCLSTEYMGLEMKRPIKVRTGNLRYCEFGDR